MKLCLGTVQFGMNYGVKNQKRPSREEVYKIFDYCLSNGIKTFDTAEAYGDAEDILGEYIRSRKLTSEDICIISKLRPNVLDSVQSLDYYELISRHLQLSLKRLTLNDMEGYLLHSSRYIYNDEIIEALHRVKQDGCVNHAGVSVYNTDEAEMCLKNSNVDLMQLPYSIFDQRMKSSGVLNSEIGRNTIIHSRSAFIQGLITMDEHDVPEYLSKAKPIVRTIDSMCKEHGLSKVQVALNYVQLETRISHLVIGVDNLIQLKENIDFFNSPISKDLLMEFAKEFKNLEANIVMPSLWKK